MLKIDKYSKEDLQKIAESCRTWSEICKAVGYSSDSSIGVIKEYFKKNGISFTSFGADRINENLLEVPAGIITVNDLNDIVDRSSTYQEIGNKLGYSIKSASGCAKKLLLKYSINFESTNGKLDIQNPSILRTCSVCGKKLSKSSKSDICYKCYADSITNGLLNKWLTTGRYCDSKSLKIPRYVKQYIINEQHHKCDICGLSDSWNGKPLVFVCDHIDGNADNQIRENLRCICPNCDSQLDTFKSKNKNSARSFRRLQVDFHRRETLS